MNNSVIDKDTYTKALHFTHDFVLKNSGTPDDAGDVFQEAILIFIEKSTAGEITADAAPTTLLYSISRNIWLDELRKRKNSNISFKLPVEIEDYNHSELDLKKTREILLELIEEQINTLKGTCRDILKGRMKGESFESIAVRMGIKDIRNIWIRYHRCKNKLYEQMNSDKDRVNEINNLIENG